LEEVKKKFKIQKKKKKIKNLIKKVHFINFDFKSLKLNEGKINILINKEKILKFLEFIKNQNCLNNYIYLNYFF
jgi:hypothetical protein